MSATEATPRLRFREDGTFKVLQLADIQEKPSVRPDTIKLLEAALNASDPDLVILTGDQIRGYDRTFDKAAVRGHLDETVSHTIDRFMAPIVRRGLPFVVTFGNHDRECGLTNETQEAIYRKLPGCLNGTGAVRQLAPGTLALDVLPSEGTGLSGHAALVKGAPRLLVLVADSGAGSITGGFAPFDPQVTAWMTSQVDDARKRAGRAVPTVVFQHIPPTQVYECLRPATSRERGWLGFRSHKAAAPYVPLESARISGDLGETVCSPDTDSGEMAALEATGDVFAVYFGHDHKNTLVSRWHGIDLGYTPCCGFNSYGPGTDRAARELTFHEVDPAAYETRLLRYRDLVSATTENPFVDMVTEVMPTTPDQLHHDFMQALGLLVFAGTLTAGIVVAISSSLSDDE